MLEAVGISKFYRRGKNKITGCSNISFNVKEGEITSLLGLNGAGKSTVLGIISGCISPSAGQVFIGGFSVITEPIQAKRQIGVLFENNPLYNDMTVKEFLIFSASIHGVKKEKAVKAVKETAEFCALEQVINKRISTLSKGFRQRTGLAQALVHNPSLIILDEPASGLDMHQLHSFQQKILQLDKKKAVLVSTHNLDMARRICSKHILMNKGEVIIKGSLEDIAGKVKTENTGMEITSFDEVLETAFNLFAGVNKNEFFKSAIG